MSIRHLNKRLYTNNKPADDNSNEVEIIFSKTEVSLAKSFFETECKDGNPGIFIQKNGDLKLIAEKINISKKEMLSLASYEKDMQIIKPDWLREAVANATMIDWQTGLYIRDYFFQAVRQEIQRHICNTQYRFSVLVIEIDSLKIIENVLKVEDRDSIRAFVSQEIQSHNTVWWKKEGAFLILLPGQDAESAYKTAEQEWITMTASEALHNICPNGVTVSIGIAEFPTHLSANNKNLIKDCADRPPFFFLNQETFDAIVGNITNVAEQALSHAQKQGGNKSKIYQQDDKK